MNDAGTVAFIAPTDDAGAMDALFIADRAELTRAIDGGSRFVGMNYADINNSGTVVFHAEQDPSGDGSGVFSFAAGDLRTVIENGTPFGELLGIGPVLLNDDGVVAFVANVAPGATGQGIVTTDGNSITVVADESGIADMRLSSMYPFAVNDEGVVSPSRPK